MRDALAQLREVDVIAHVIRGVDDRTVRTRRARHDPCGMRRTWTCELMLSDHDQIARTLERLEKDFEKEE